MDRNMIVSSRSAGCCDRRAISSSTARIAVAVIPGSRPAFSSILQGLIDKSETAGNAELEGR